MSEKILFEAKILKGPDQRKTDWDESYLFSMKKSVGVQKSICSKIQKSHTSHEPQSYLTLFLTPALNLIQTVTPRLELQPQCYI